ncbi:MAG: electron transport complex subunit E [Lachnospiraceae bacterium]|nr:electron transport complex subunit E [Lachnospiraceae bacterium]
MNKDTVAKRLVNGIFKENPTFVLMLGMCPTLAVTTSAINGLGMGLTTMVVLALSNLIISLLRKIIPNRVRIPAFIVIIASFVTVAELLLKAYIPFLYDALGLYIPLIVVNCIILGRAEAYASKNGPILSLFDGIGMGLGFTLALTIIGAVRELLGAGTCFDQRVLPESYIPCTIFILAPGAFFVLAILTAIQNKIRIEGEKKGKDMSKIQSGCGADCMNCHMECMDPALREKTLGKAEEEKPEEKPAEEEKPEEKPAEEKKPEEKPAEEEKPEEKPAEEGKPEEKPAEEEKPEEKPAEEGKPEEKPAEETKSEEIKEGEAHD